MKDRATYSDAELARYGLPRRSPGEPFEHWASIVRGAGKRVCDRTVTDLRSQPVTNTTDIQSDNWDGNIADEPFLGGQSYTEITMFYYVPCVTGSVDSYMSSWVGLGGLGNSNLVQTGTSAHRVYVANYGWYTIYQAWVENLADPNNPNENDVFSVNCGDYIYVQVYEGNCMFVDDSSNGQVSYQCYGPNADDTTAEAITERPTIGGSLTQLANFGTSTFHAVAIVDNCCVNPMNQLQHDYSNMWSTNGNYTIATVGPIQNDPGNSPYDQWSMTWQRYW